MSVLVLARDFDPTADAVVERLSAEGVEVLRTDLADFPQRLQLDARLRDGRWSGRVSTEHHSVTLEGLRSVWYRNPSAYSVPAGLESAERNFVFREAKLGLGGVLAALPDVLWANSPNRCADALYKPYQWAVAAQCGLTVADTVITNSSGAVREFVDDHPDVVSKPLGGAGMTSQGQAYVSYTHRLTVADLADLDGVAMTASTVQEWVPKSYEVRVTAIGEEWFPVRIDAGDGGQHDWRADPEGARYTFVDMPNHVYTGLAELMHRLGLAYTGADFIVRPDGQWVFLEANSGPQFGWLETATGADMTGAMARLLAKGLTT